MGITCETNPIAIYENLGHFLVAKVFSCELLKLLDTPVMQLVDHVYRVTTDRDECHESQVLHKTASATLWRLCWTDHSPVRVVQLSWLGQLSLLRKRCRQSAHMRKGRGKSKPGEHLGHARLQDIVLLVPLPVSSREGRLESSSDRLMPHGLVDQEFLFVRVQILLNLLDHLVNELPEKGTVKTC